MAAKIPSYGPNMAGRSSERTFPAMGGPTCRDGTNHPGSECVLSGLGVLYYGTEGEQFSRTVGSAPAAALRLEKAGSVGVPVGGKMTCGHVSAMQPRRRRISGERCFDKRFLYVIKHTIMFKMAQASSACAPMAVNALAIPRVVIRPRTIGPNRGLSAHYPSFWLAPGVKPHLLPRHPGVDTSSDPVHRVRRRSGVVCSIA